MKTHLLPPDTPLPWKNEPEVPQKVCVVSSLWVEALVGNQPA